MIRFELIDARGGSQNLAESYSSLPQVILSPFSLHVDKSLEVAKWLSHFSQTDKDLIKIKKGRDGRPFWENNYGLDFNYSHSHDLWMIGFTNKGRIGVDIESMNQERDFQSLADRFFSKRESQVLKEIDNMRLKREIFLKMWTAKESLVKALGVGLKNQINVIEVDPGSGEIISLPEAFGDSSLWTVKYFSVDPDWVLTAAHQSKSST